MKRRTFLKLSAAGGAALAGLPLMASATWGQTATPRPSNARFIWYDTIGQGRSRYAAFRKTFVIKGKITSAILHLFADTVYQLFVNGQFIEFGPGRFDPRFPMYDSHQLDKYLKPGPNVIAVLVNYFGVKTYKSIAGNAGMIAWGEILTDKKEKISLVTNKTNWKAAPEATLENYTPKLGFALNPSILSDERKSIGPWKSQDFDDSRWNAAVELDRQDYWGSLEKRNIPFMSGAILSPRAITGCLPLRAHNDRYSFSVPAPDFFEDSRSELQYIVFYTHIYSPVDQEVMVSTFWAEHYLNGLEITDKAPAGTKQLRMNEKWALRKGWNYLFGYVKVYFDVFDHYFDFPSGKGILLSADQNQDSGIRFRHTRVLSRKEFQTYIQLDAFRESPQELDFGTWLETNDTQTAQSPVRETAWDDYGEQVDLLDPSTVQGFTFTKQKYPDGFALVFDLGHTQLTFPQFELSGVSGATVDVTFSERLAKDNQHIHQVFNFPLGDRVLCASDKLNWTPVQPRGGRYVMLTVRNTQKDITLHHVSFRLASYPVTLKGSFQSSDPLLNAIWDISALTQSVNMEDAYVDTTVRERGMYGRDTVIQYCVNLACYGDHALMHRCMQLYGQSPDATGKLRAVFPNTGDYTIADFCLDLVEGYLIYALHSGDFDRVKADWPAIQGNLKWFHSLSDQREDLLLDSDWAEKQGIKAHYGGFHGDLQFDKANYSVHGVNSSFSATYHIALMSAARLAHHLGYADEAHALETRAVRLAASITSKFWDAQHQCFADNLDMNTRSIQCNLIIARAGIIKPEQLEGVRKHVAYELRSVFKNGYNSDAGALCSPSYAFYLFDGLYKLGLVKTAEDLMRDGWGLFLTLGLKTTAEYWNVESEGLSHSHAWSAAPAWYLSTQALGVQFPNLPDTNVVNIRVQTHYLSHAEGSYPHPKGLIEVKWHTEEGKRVFDYVKAPEGVRVEITG